jgi:signal transduction histidine kinase
MEPVGDVIETGEFDREYGLADLLPLAQAGALLHVLDPDLGGAVIYPDGRPYHGLLRAHQALADLWPSLNKQTPDPIPFVDGPFRGILIPLCHELETLGYLVLESGLERFNNADLACFGRIAAQAIERILALNCQHQMTAGLHGQVVTDNYRRLRHKADQLARSEEKYRRLAQDLEAEVARKTHKIRDAQVRMLQQEKLAAIGQLAAGMAHEINNPVGFVISNLNTLRDNVGDMVAMLAQYRQLADQVAGEGRADEALSLQMASIEALGHRIDIDFLTEDMDTLIGESLEGAGRVQQIVQNLRDFTHPGIDARESVDINQCLETTLTLLANQIPQTVSLRRDYQSLPSLKCHLREINQALFNILKNALQAVGEEGCITIRTRVDTGGVRIDIGDNGVGMPPEIVQRVFDPFFTTREVGGGAGLGLTQAYNSVKSHGGRIEVKSRIGSGSTFTLVLPEDRGEKPSAATDQPS